MKVLHRQEFFHSFLKPFATGFGLAFRAMPVSAGIVGVEGMPAVIALIHMTAESCGPTGDEGVDHLPLLGADLSQLVEMVPKDISYFPTWSLPLGF